MSRGRLLVACEIFERELRALAAGGDGAIETAFLPQGLHDRGAPAMKAALQEAVDHADPAAHEAVLLGWAMCGRGLVGLKAPAVPMIVPKAHDCIGLLLGSRSRHETMLREHPGTYWRSCGWIEKAGPPGSGKQLRPEIPGTPYTWEQLVEKFGEEDAKEIAATLSSHLTNYDRLSFIVTGVEPDGSLEARAQTEARELGWQYTKVQGDLGWLGRLIHGPWQPDEFLTVPPGAAIADAFDGTVIRLA